MVRYLLHFKVEFLNFSKRMEERNNLFNHTQPESGRFVAGFRYDKSKQTPKRANSPECRNIFRGNQKERGNYGYNIRVQVNFNFL